MLIKNETCVICHPIFFQFISSCRSIRSRARPNDHKFFITPEKSKKAKRKALKKRYFVSTLSIWYNVLSPKINNTPFPNKCKALFHSQIFCFCVASSHRRGESEKYHLWPKSKQIALPLSCPLVILISIYAECCAPKTRCKSLNTNKSSDKTLNKISMGSWQIDLIWISNFVQNMLFVSFRFIKG